MSRVFLKIKFLIMRVKYLFLILILLIGFSGCEDDSSSLEVSQSVFNNVSSDGATLEVDVMSSDAWVVSDNATWCTVAPEKGNGNQKITIKVEANIELSARTATITISSDKSDSRSIQLNQDGANISLDDYHYKLPVIFHVLYHDKNDNNQYVEPGRLPEVLKRVNELYRNAGSGSANMNLEFVLATEDPEGRTLPEPGVERIEWNTAAIDINDFMFNNDGIYNYLIWEPNDYINVMVYTFTEEEIMGVAHFPYSPTEYPLEGTENAPEQTTGANLSYAYCVSINNYYIYEETTTALPNQNDMAVTLAHEFGHYLGLRHVFSEATENGVSICKDTDYCTDTYTYSRDDYKTWVESLQSSEISFKKLTQRHDCVRGIDFTSRNIMDYAYSYLNEFTDDQKARVRHVLTYSPLIPGPKKGRSQTRSTVEGILDLPIVVMR